MSSRVVKVNSRPVLLFPTAVEELRRHRLAVRRGITRPFEALCARATRDSLELLIWRTGQLAGVHCVGVSGDRLSRRGLAFAAARPDGDGKSFWRVNWRYAIEAEHFAPGALYRV